MTVGMPTTESHPERRTIRAALGGTNARMLRGLLKRCERAAEDSRGWWLALSLSFDEDARLIRARLAEIGGAP